MFNAKRTLDRQRQLEFAIWEIANSGRYGLRLFAASVSSGQRQPQRELLRLRLILSLRLSNRGMYDAVRGGDVGSPSPGHGLPELPGPGLRAAAGTGARRGGRCGAGGAAGPRASPEPEAAREERRSDEETGEKGERKEMR